MGSLNSHFVQYHKKPSFVNLIDQDPSPYQNNLTPLDLPYRHYVNRRQYIASALPHPNIQYHSDKKSIRISDNIRQSSIMIRRFQ